MGQMGEEQMGGVIACDKMCLGVVSTCSLLSGDKSPSFLTDETPGEGIHDHWLLLEVLSLGG